MRITINVDSATPEQVYDLTLAFQRTRNIGVPTQLTMVPTVTVAGTCMGWTSPALKLAHVPALLHEYTQLRFGREP